MTVPLSTEPIATLHDTGNVMYHALTNIVNTLRASPNQTYDTKLILNITESALRMRDKEFARLEEKGIQL